MITCANQSTGTVLGDITLPIYVRKQRFSVTFKVLSNASSDIFLGIPFLQEHKAILDFSEDPIKLYFQNPIYAADHFTIEPFSEVICKGKLFHSVENSAQGHCAPFPSIHSKGILAAHSAVTVHDNMVPIRLFNGTNIRRTINKGERLATFEHYDESDVPSLDCIHADVDPIHLDSCKTTNDVHREPDIDWSKTEATGKDLQRLKSLVNEFPDCFVDPVTKTLGLTDLISCKIDTFPNAMPFQKYPYHMALSQREEMNKIVKQQLEQQLIEEAKDGAWASPALLVKKRQEGSALLWTIGHPMPPPFLKCCESQGWMMCWTPWEKPCLNFSLFLIVLRGSIRFHWTPSPGLRQDSLLPWVNLGTKLCHRVSKMRLLLSKLLWIHSFRECNTNT